MAYITIKSLDEFNAQLEEAGDQLVVVDFWAEWCGPCKFIAPKFEEFSTKYTNVKFLKVNTDDQSEIAGQQSITSLPTFRFFKNCKRCDDVIGANATKLEEKIQELSN
ncbi:23361_t:CDS:2 [Cetraspora pellucida]|uniref:Thioredoxin n=1 Tax=Cetraspora pellucida TaxID=1433469 RepID=A0A9N9HRP0_9GLOM|nr:23361_t:CDS:2 [Cetraspora pellucida]